MFTLKQQALVHKAKAVSTLKRVVHDRKKMKVLKMV